MKFSDLCNLRNIIDKLELEPLLCSSDCEELIESTLILIDTFVTNNIYLYSEPYFSDILFDGVYNLLNLQLDEVFYYDIEEELSLIIHYSLNYYYIYGIPERSYKKTFIRNKTPNVDKMRKKIEFIQKIPQPMQRTDAWYEFRYNLITASTAWKALNTESNQNQLIYEKCSPLDITKYRSTFTASSLHWGQKYEPLSLMYYQDTYKTSVEDFGCIQHQKYRFLGASPDGINTNPNNKLYGRILEIKNIVNRDITKIPKKEYWIQMQLQMETCNLNECDFLETRFKEYENEEEFDADGTFTHTANEKLKGIIMYFMKEGQTHYEYMPLHYSREQYLVWETDIMQENKDLTWLKNIYWYLDEVSCILVLRNKEWFAYAIEQIQKSMDNNRKRTCYWL